MSENDGATFGPKLALRRSMEAPQRGGRPATSGGTATGAKSAGSSGVSSRCLKLQEWGFR